MPTHWMRNGGRIVSGTTAADYKNCGNLKWHEFKVLSIQIPAHLFGRSHGCAPNGMRIGRLWQVGRRYDHRQKRFPRRCWCGRCVGDRRRHRQLSRWERFTWTSTLTVTKNIQIIGAGEGSTVITENLPRTNNASLSRYFPQSRVGGPCLFLSTQRHDFEQAPRTPLCSSPTTPLLNFAGHRTALTRRSLTFAVASAGVGLIT